MKKASPAELWTMYTQLPEPARLVLQLKALVWPVDLQNLFLDALTAAGGRDTGGKPWRQLTLTNFCGQLKTKGLLDSKSGIAPSLLHRVAVDAVAGKNGKRLVESIKATYPTGRLSMSWDGAHADSPYLLRIRLALYANDPNEFNGRYIPYHDSRDSSAEPHFFDTLFRKDPIDTAWLFSRSPLMQYAIFFIKVGSLFYSGAGTPELDALLAHYAKRRWEPGFEPFRVMLHHIDLLAGNRDALQDYARRQREEAARCNGEVPDDKDSDDPLINATGVEAYLDFLAGRNDAAITGFREAIKRLRKRSRSRKAIPAPPYISMYLLALLRDNAPAQRKEVQALLDIINARDQGKTHNQYAAVQSLLWFTQGMTAKARERVALAFENLPESPLNSAFITMATCVIAPELTRNAEPLLEKRFNRLNETMPMLARIYAEVLERASATPAPYTAYLREACGGDETIRFLSTVEQRDSWERVLEGLNGLLRPEGKKAPRKEGPHKRLAWLLDTDDLDLSVVEQTSKPRLGWTSGRPLALKRLYARDPKLPFTEHDSKVLPALRKEYSTWGWRRVETFVFNLSKALPLLVGHPCILDALTQQPIELVSHTVEVVVKEEAKGYRLSLSHLPAEGEVILEAETPTRFRVIEYAPQLTALQELLGAKGTVVPPQARERVLELIREEGSLLPIRAEVAEADVAVQDGLTTPIMQLQPLGQGLKATLAVRPFGKDGPCYVPGMGAEAVLAVMDGQSRRARRDFKQERAAAKLVVQSCPTLLRLGGSREWDIDDIESSLELLLELQNCPKPVVLEWPEGVSYAVSPPAGSSSLSLTLRKSRDWLQIDGKIRVDESLVVSIQDLLKNIDKSVGQFVPLGEGRFLALTRELQRQLSRLALLSEPAKAGRMVHTLGAAAMLDLVESAGEVDADQAWNELAERIRQAGEHAPSVPSTLQAQLRDYQVEGFTWLSRLAHWGAGACLADDMGLGKTVQTIAAMLEQSPKGPCLVVAPTSVCHNWDNEIARFAPTLTPYTLAGAGDREALVSGLGPGDVLITSYGLMNTSSELLAGRVWQVAVFDEAQAIKNTQTRRAQASRKIEAAFRVALTGTPVENYLDELWSLFNTINPGLLGSRDSFRRRFGIPIERDHDKNARQALKALLRPFILRRTKSAVLSELPPRTELTVDVELPEAERAFYEALRRRALESLESLDSQAPGQRKIHILAELTRLRRACCHPGLIDPGAGLSSAKLDTFLEMVDELRRSNHKALVFSQFVGYLQRVRQALDQAGVRYQYLDGSTPAAERQRSVAAFQAGEGDLFLISLRAGGTGLNLTAADYVFHLDPWWNPAVEDQASDRAHRIGQNRPVTIYRLIVKDSVEEKILRLHRDKRELAADLLEGTDSGVRLGEEELLALLQA